MGIDYDSVTVVGFYVERDDLLKQLPRKKIPEKKHKEKRFHPKTGERLEDVVVIDQEATEVVLIGDDDEEGLDVDDLVADELCDALGEMLNCDCSCHGDFVSGEYMFITFEPIGFKQREDGVFISEIVRFQKDFDDLGKRLKEAGIDAGKPGVWSLTNIS